MRLNLTGRHLAIAPALRRLVTVRVGKLERVLNDSAVSAQVVLAREKHRHLTEITLHARGEQFLHAVGDTGNWEMSLAEATDKLAHQVLGRSLDDVPPQARHLLQLLDHMVTENCTKASVERSAYRFGRRDVRAYTGWSDFQVRSHIEKLVELEYVLVHRGGRGQLFSYELLYDGHGGDGAPFLVGLLDVEKLKFEGPKSEFEGGSRGHRAVIEAPSSPAEIEEKPNETMGLPPTSEFTAETTSQETTSTASYQQTGEGTP